MSKNEILESKGIDSTLFKFYYVTDNGTVISPEFNHEGNILKSGEEVYNKWLFDKEHPSSPTPNEMEVLKEEVIALEKENKLLKAQVEALSQTSDFHEELIVEMANKVYA